MAQVRWGALGDRVSKPTLNLAPIEPRILLVLVHPNADGMEERVQESGCCGRDRKRFLGSSVIIRRSSTTRVY